VTVMRARRLGLVWRIVAVVASLGVLGLGAVCCQQVLSIDGAIEVRGPEGGSDVAEVPDVQDGGLVMGEAGIDCGILVPSGLCASCVTGFCCSQMSACAGDKQCRSLETCLLGCGHDYACRSACNTAAYPVGAQLVIPELDTCVAVSCSSQCGMPCGQAASYTTPADAAPACETCIENPIPSPKVCTAAQACFTSLACQTSGHCAQACTTPDCRNACANDAGDDLTLFNAAFQEGEVCYTPCRVGQNWTCVNRVVWPEVEDGGAQQATVTVVDAFTGALIAPPVPDVSVKACGGGDYPCTTALSTGTANDAGIVTLPNLGSSPILGFSGHFEMTVPGYVQNLFYLSWPLSQANAQLTLGLMSQTTFASALAGVNITPVAGRGTVWVQVQDCLLLPAPNVVVKADGLDQASVVYTTVNDPILTATSTDLSGYAFLFNVAPGPLTLRAIPNDTGVESSTVTVDVRADAMTVAWLLPTEAP
jgi:hypothetical protein